MSNKVANYSIKGKRAKRPDELAAEAAQAHAAEAMAKVVHLMHYAEEEKLQLQAAKEILDRAYGKSKNTLDVNSKHEETQTVVFDAYSIPLEARQKMLEAERNGQTVIEATFDEIEPLDPALLENKDDNA